MQEISKKLLFFSPHANIWQHAIPEALIAFSLKSKGYEVKFMGCKGILSDRCTTFDALGIRGEIPDDLRKKTCQKCIAKQKATDKKLQSQRFWLDDFVSKAENKSIRENLDLIQDSDWQTTEFEDVATGKFATYEVLLNYKLGEIKFHGNSLAEYKGHLTGCHLALQGFRNYFKENHFDTFFCYNSLYSVNHSLMHFLKRKHIQTLTFHSGNNFSQRLKRMVVSDATTIDHEKHLLNLWPRYSNIPCESATSSFITDHLMVMMGANSMFQYGAKFDSNFKVREHWGISTDQKILLATMSSQDERFAAEAVGVGWEKENNLLFNNQIDWVHWLIDFVKDRPDCFLIIRVHPREFPNKREKQLSQQAIMLSELFKNLPPNVIVNYPTENISIYNLMRETDVLLNHHSSSGREFAMIGKPVVIYSKGISSFPTDFCILGLTESEYSKAIEQALSTPFDFERIRRVYRWLALDHVYASMNLSDVITFSEKKKKYSFSNLALKTAEISGIHPLYALFLDWFHPLRLRKAGEIYKLIQVIEHHYSSLADIFPEATLSETEETFVLEHELKRIRDYLAIPET